MHCLVWGRQIRTLDARHYSHNRQGKEVDLRLADSLARSDVGCSVSSRVCFGDVGFTVGSGLSSGSTGLGAGLSVGSVVGSASGRFRRGLSAWLRRRGWRFWRRSRLFCRLVCCFGHWSFCHLVLQSSDTADTVARRARPGASSMSPREDRQHYSLLESFGICARRWSPATAESSCTAVRAEEPRTSLGGNQGRASTRCR